MDGFARSAAKRIVGKAGGETEGSDGGQLVSGIPGIGGGAAEACDGDDNKSIVMPDPKIRDPSGLVALRMEPVVGRLPEDKNSLGNLRRVF
mgnify:CR=1 FL=1